MELQMRDGDYLPDGRGGFLTLKGGEAVLQRALFLLTARRGGFPFLPQVGSRLYLLPREKASVRPALARQYAGEALAALAGVTVTEADTVERADGRLDVRVLMEWNGTQLEAGVTV